MSTLNIVEEAIKQTNGPTVKVEMEGNDGSHDWYHIERVHNNALAIARKEGMQDVELVELGAILHDVADWKYSGDEHAASKKVRSFLSSVNYPTEKIDIVVKLIEGIGFKGEIGLSPEEAALKTANFIELAVVQDADRLDAIGAIGIARTFTYGGKKNRPLHIPGTEEKGAQTKAEYMKHDKAATIQHFYEKLLLLKGLMKTKTGKEMAEQRHSYMEMFLEQFFAEWDGKR